MHAVALVVMPKEATDPDAYVAQAMEPFRESDHGPLTGHWDWWQIGGRWTGALDGYDPNSDPSNVEPCLICGGSGLRSDAASLGEDWLKWSGGCNGCKGTGSRVTWPTNFRRRAGDVGPVTAAKERDFLPYTVLTPKGEWVTREIQDGSYDEKDQEAWQAEVMALLDEYADHLCVVVDYHS